MLDYQKIHDSLISFRKANRLTKDKSDPRYVYCERHHIKPQCLGGTNDPDNLVLLTAKEHAFIHHMLHMIYPDNAKLTLAFSAMFMCNGKNGRTRFLASSKIVGKMKEEAAIARRQALLERMSTMTAEQREQFRRKKSESAKRGWARMSDEMREKRSRKISNSLLNPSSKIQTRTEEQKIQRRKQISEMQLNYSGEKKQKIVEKRLQTINDNIAKMSDEELETLKQQRHDAGCKAWESRTDEEKQEYVERGRRSSKEFWDNATDDYMHAHSKRMSKIAYDRYDKMSAEKREEFRRNLSKAKTGQKWMTDGKNRRLIMAKDVEQFLKDGWVITGPDMARFRGTKYMNNGKEHLRVPESEWDSYLKRGWVFGRLSKANRK